MQEGVNTRVTEGNQEQFHFIKTAFSDYNFLYVGREGAVTGGVALSHFREG